jgi:hypothetical protein
VLPLDALILGRQNVSDRVSGGGAGNDMTAAKRYARGLKGSPSRPINRYEYCGKRLKTRPVKMADYDRRRPSATKESCRSIRLGRDTQSRAPGAA